jgi:recombinational DNA repair protein (RecF pathway)
MDGQTLGLGQDCEATPAAHLHALLRRSEASLLGRTGIPGTFHICCSSRRTATAVHTSGKELGKEIYDPC